MGPDRTPSPRRPDRPADAVVRGAVVMAAGGPRERAEVVVHDGRISEVRPATDDVPDVVLVPGFVDLQVNGIGPIDVRCAADDGDWEALDRALLAQGVTTWCPTVISAPLDEARAALERVSRAAARPGHGRPDIAGAHLEGPFLAVAGAHRPDWLLPTVDTDWLLGLRPLPRVVTVSPELAGAVPAVEALVSGGVLVALGHSAAGPDVVLAAVDAGARLVTHVGNATGPMWARQPGLLGTALADRRLTVSLIADLEHSHPVFVQAVFAAKGASGVALVTDAVAGAPGTTVAPRLADGTLAGSVLTMDGALSNVVGCGATDLAGAVCSASTVPATLAGLTDRGSIAPGRRADLVALEERPDGSWRPSSVWVEGVASWPR